jgi:ABC-type lipoprotein export system ATPase subunit
MQTETVQPPTPADHKDLIVLEDVSREYVLGNVTVTALGHVDLHVDEGEFVVVLGPSGSGKTTLINLIGALDIPTSGTIHVGEVDVTEATRKELFAFRRRLVSFIFQSFNIFLGLTARENVQFGIDASHALAASQLDDHHADPIDRLLVCQAKEERMRLVTTDTSLGAYGIDVLDAVR